MFGKKGVVFLLCFFSIFVFSFAHDEDEIAGASTSGKKHLLEEKYDDNLKNLYYGTDNIVNGKKNLVFGNEIAIKDDESVSVGSKIGSTGHENISYGSKLTLVGEDNTVLGKESSATGTGNIVIGRKNNAGNVRFNSDFINVVGNRNSISNSNETSILGNGNTVEDSSNNFVISKDSYLSNSKNNVILGTDNAAFNVENSIILGSGSSAYENNVLSIGKKNKERKIINVKAGKISEKSTEAIVGNQLWKTNNVIEENKKEFVEYKKNTDENINSIKKEINEKNSVVNSKIEKLDKELKSSISSLAAMSGIDFQNAPIGAVGVGAAIGGYHNSNAVAVGITYGISKDFRVNGKVGIPFGKASNTAYTVGATYYFGN